MKSFFTHKEELWNSWTHAAGIVLGVVVGCIFITWCARAENGWALASIILYLFGMLCSYVASTLYHAMPAHSPWKGRLRHWDHAAIYWHIAGSYSPITLVAMRGDGIWGWALFGFVWAAALLGTFMSFRRLRDHSHLETACFCLMGLSIVAAFRPLIDCVPASSVIWIVAEGGCYLTGAVFYSLNRLRYMHTVFHFFVLMGSVCHIVAVWGILMQWL